MTWAAPTPRFRRAADHSAIRLGRALLGYLACVTLIITLAPFRFAARPVHGLTAEWDWLDVVMNVVMFVPIGFVFRLSRPAGTTVRWLHVALVGLVLSAAIETAQLFEASRFTSLLDVATNTAGALLGAGLFELARARVEAPGTVRALSLEMPLMGLSYLLVPLIWLTGLASGGDSRVWLTLPVVAFGAGILGTVHAAASEPARDRPRLWLVAAVIGWYATAMLPGAAREPDLLLAGAATAIGVAWLRGVATIRHRQRGARRIELPTLRLLLPLFAAFLALSSLWPLQDVDGAWHAIGALSPGGAVDATSVYRALEHIAAFTLVGYVIAEFHGRARKSDSAVMWRVMSWGGGLSLLLEAARGLHPSYRASAVMLLFTSGAAAYGGWLYQLQRDQVLALLTRRDRRPLPTSFDPGGQGPSYP